MAACCSGGHPTLAHKLMPSAVIHPALVEWPSSWMVPHAAPPAVDELAPSQAFLLSLNQSLTQDQVTSMVWEPLERPNELAAPKVQLSMLDSQPENGWGQHQPLMRPHSLRQSGWLLIGLLLPKQPIPVKTKLASSQTSAMVTSSRLCNALCIAAGGFSPLHWHCHSGAFSATTLLRQLACWVQVNCQGEECFSKQEQTYQERKHL